jgi:hypothetical protein
MVELEQFRIELNADDIKEILQSWGSERLEEKGYEFDHFWHDEPFPLVTIRGVKIDRGLKEGDK